MRPKDLPVFIVEKDGARLAMSAAELSQHERFWTVDGPFFASAENLIREVESGASLSGVIDALKVKSLVLPSDVVLCTAPRENSLDNYALMEWEVDTVRIDRKHRRVDLGWSKRRDEVKRWHYLTSDQVRDVLSDYTSRRKMEHQVMFHSVAPKTTALALRSGIIIASDEVCVEGATCEAAVEIGGLIYVLPSSLLGKYLRDWLGRVDNKPDKSVILLSLILFDLASSLIGGGRRSKVDYFYDGRAGRDESIASWRRETGLTSEEVLRYCESRGLDTPPVEFDAVECGAIMCRRNMRVFSPSAWRRSEDE